MNIHRYWTTYSTVTLTAQQTVKLPLNPFLLCSIF